MDLEFELHRGHLIVVPGVVGTYGSVRLLLDTGTSRTVVGTPVAESLHLQGQPASVRTFRRTLAATEVVIPELQFGIVRATRLRVVAADLSSTAASLGMARLDGIVGMDVLGRMSFAIDYQRRRLVFNADAPVRHRIPLGADPIFPVISVEIGGVPAELIVDTGASHVVLFLPAGDRTFEGVGGVPASILGGDTAIRGLFLPELRVGAWRASHLSAVVAEAPVASRPVKGLLAPTVLGSSYLQFDFRRRELGWRP